MKYYFLLKKEIKDLFFSKASLLFGLILSYLTGYSFYSAVILYSQASKSAINNPLYASGFEPVAGIFRPSMGGIFILLSLMLPFLIIPQISNEKENNTIIFLLQIPFKLKEIFLIKFTAALIYLVLIFSFILPSLFLWLNFSGKLPLYEFLILITGYFLYGIWVISISFLSASIFKNSSSASIFSLFLITLSWFMDFGNDMNIAPFIVKISKYSVTATLETFENGIFSLSALIYFFILISLSLYLSFVFLKIKPKFNDLIFAVLILTTGTIFLNAFKYNKDLTQSHRNSFPENINASIRKLPPLKIKIFLRKTDSRYKDYEESFLNKLKLIKNDVEIVFANEKELQKNYGIFEYEINNKVKKTYSNSEEEIFPIIFKLSGITPDKENHFDTFKGYPLIVKEDKINLIKTVYYIIIPLVLIIIALKKSRMFLFFSKKEA